MSAVISTDIDYQGPFLDATAVAAMDLGDEKQREQLQNFIAHKLSKGEESCIFEVVQAVIAIDRHQGVNGMTMALVLDRSLLIDAIWVADAEIDEFESDDEIKKKRWACLVQLITMLKGQGLLTEPMMQERFSIDLLNRALPRFPAKAFETECIRRRTKMIYKQQKFNLLREESEGYAKLMTELMQTLLRVQSLIGYFDLDPNRVVDIILDVFAYNILKYHAYFLTLIRASPWYGTRERPTNIIATNSTSTPATSVPGQAIMVNIFAQLMGQKFAYYSRWQQEHPDRSTRTPEEITFAAALLIREGIMSVDDLLPHLTPIAEDTKNEYTCYLQDKIDGLRNNRTNLLASAAALIDDSPSIAMHSTATTNTSSNTNTNTTTTTGTTTTTTTTTTTATTSSIAHPPPHQRADLCAALLAIGDLTAAGRLLALHPYLPSIRVDIALTLGRAIDYLIEPFYMPARPVSLRKIPPSGRVDYTWDILPTGNCAFFFAPWTDRLDDYIKTQDGTSINEIQKYLSLLQLGLSKCPALLVKICRIAVYELATVSASTTLESLMSDHNDDMMYQQKKDAWMNILREYLLPAVSCMRANPATLHELWLLLELYTYEQRFGIYGEWTTRYGDNTRVAKATKEPACIWGLVLARAKTEASVKSIMQRISAETIKESGRRLAKASHAAPTIAFRAVMFQLKTYDNMTQSVTDAFKYLSRFGYDVLTYTILELFANDQDRLQQDGQHISTWLRNLASFCGQAIRRYSSISSEAIIQYIVNQMRHGNTNDLFILEQIIKEVASMEAGAILTEHQLYAAGGGELLRREALIVEKSPRPLRRPGVRVMRSLLQSHLGLVLAVLMGQTRRDMVYTSERDFLDNLKVLGSRYDQLTGQLHQFADFFREFTSPTEYDTTLPDLDILCGQYGLEPEVAFHWLRPKYHRQLKKRLATKLADNQVSEGDKPVERIEDSVMNTEDTMSMQVDTSSILLTPDMEVMARSLLPLDVWDHLSPAFYMMFWQLSAYDIYVPETQYTAQERTLRDERQDIERGHRNLIYQSNSIRHTMCSRINGWEKGLRMELETHKKHTASIHNLLEQEKQQWFNHIKDPRKTAAYVFQYCIRPRLLFSDVDALYCFKFIETMHQLAVPGLWTMGLYNSILRRSLSNWIFSCTEKEAKRLGQYMKHILIQLTKWHMKEGEFVKNGRGDGWPGFTKQPLMSLLQVVPVHADQQMSLDDLTQAMITWHRYLHETFADCLASGEYMQIRNAISILTEILDYFPLIDRPGRIMQSEYVKKLQEDERNDLRILAIG
ncbi:transcription factor/nuclear export subunit protein 2-domain-containing protein [Syncephalis fuscata]|nr:transcription factor/nuclear export subunit protein 2-domain-containing protein [Syncephalis fuscata]